MKLFQKCISSIPQKLSSWKYKVLAQEAHCVDVPEIKCSWGKLAQINFLIPITLCVCLLQKRFHDSE